MAISWAIPVEEKIVINKDESKTFINVKMVNFLPILKNAKSRSGTLNTKYPIEIIVDLDSADLVISSTIKAMI